MFYIRVTVFGVPFAGTVSGGRSFSKILELFGEYIKWVFFWVVFLATTMVIYGFGSDVLFDDG